MHEFIIGGGQITCVQQDTIDLTELGHVTNRRASTVEWVESIQMWKAEIKPEFRNHCDVRKHRLLCKHGLQGEHPPWVCHSKSRDKCIDWEVKYLEEYLCNNVTNTKEKKVDNEEV